MYYMPINRYKTDINYNSVLLQQTTGGEGGKAVRKPRRMVVANVLTQLKRMILPNGH